MFDLYEWFIVNIDIPNTKQFHAFLHFAIRLAASYNFNYYCAIPVAGPLFNLKPERPLLVFNNDGTPYIFGILFDP